MSRTWTPALPIIAASLALLVAVVLAPITPRAWAPAMLPALVIATWAGGWPGALTAYAVGAVGRLVLISPPPWAHPEWVVLWLAIHLAAVLAIEQLRRTRRDTQQARRAARERAGRAERALAARRAAFLAHASELLASSPDYETTLAAVANLAVPQIADLCVVDIVGPDGSFHPLAVAHPDPDKVRLVRELRRLYPLDPQAPYGPPRVLRTGRSVVIADLSEDAAADRDVDPAELRVATALGIRSSMAVPLLVGGRRLGVISFATTDSGRRYVASDLPFAEDLARRAAIAIDTARP